MSFSLFFLKEQGQHEEAGRSQPQQTSSPQPWGRYALGSQQGEGVANPALEKTLGKSSVVENKSRTRRGGHAAEEISESRIPLSLNWREDSQWPMYPAPPPPQDLNPLFNARCPTEGLSIPLPCPVYTTFPSQRPTSSFMSGRFIEYKQYARLSTRPYGSGSPTIMCIRINQGISF